MSEIAYEISLKRGVQKWGAKFDTSSMDACKTLLTFFDGPRVRLTRTYENGETFTRSGRISRTTGWKPALILMSRSNAIGSSDVLDANDKLVAVQVNGRYQPVQNWLENGSERTIRV
jgi:hypothetical protein